MAAVLCCVDPKWNKQTGDTAYIDGICLCVGFLALWRISEIKHWVIKSSGIQTFLNMSTSRNLDLSKNLIILVSLKVKLQISFEYCNIQINHYIRQKLWVELKWQGMWNVDCNLSTRLISNIPTQNIPASNTPPNQISWYQISSTHQSLPFFRLTLEQNWSGWRSGWPRPRRSLTEERLWLVSKQSWPRAENMFLFRSQTA